MAKVLTDQERARKEWEKRMEKLARGARKAKERREAAEAEEKALKEEIKRELEQAGLLKMTAGIFKISWIKSMRSFFDETKFKAENKELAARYTEQRPNDYVTIR